MVWCVLTKLEQGINLLRTSPRAILPIPYIANRQPAYSTYTTFLAPYMSAYITQTRTPVSRPGYSILTYGDALIPMTLPPLSLSFAKDIPQEAMDKIKELGGNDQMVQRTRIFIVGNYDSGFVKDMVRVGAIKTAPSPMNTINIFCIPVLVFLRKLISCFLRTHTYPAFIDPEHVSSFEGLVMISGIGKRKAEDDAGSSSKKIRTVDNITSSSLGEAEMEEDDPVQVPEDTPVTSDKILMALPPSNKINGWGDESEIPVGHGLFFRYVPELAEQDSRTIPEIIAKHFFYCLGTTETDIRNTFDDIRSVSGVIADSSLGKEWAHMLKVIDIGLSVQGRIFPIFSSDRYTGCVVSGFGFSIKLYKDLFYPVPFDQLRKKVMESSPFKSIMHQISTLVPDADNETEEYELGIDDVDTIIKLRRFVSERAINEKERDDIRRLAMKLRFPHAHWAINPKQLADALSIATSVNEDFSDDLPLHPSMLFEKDWFSCIWSCFGSLAPSCVFIGGPLVDLSSSTAASGSIAWRQTALLDAIREMQTVIRDKKFAKGQGNRRSGAFKDRLYHSDQAKVIWAALRNAAGVELTGKDRKAKEAGAPSVEESYDF